MADLEFKTYKCTDWLWEFLDSTGTPYRYDPEKMVYIVYGTKEKHDYIRGQLQKKGVKLVE